MSWARPSEPPGPGLLRLALSLPSIRRDPLAFLLRMSARYGDLVLLNGGFRRYYVLRHPDAIRHVLQTNQKNYGKMTALESLMEEGLSVSEGPAWQQQRRQIQRAFDPAGMEAIARIVTEAALELRSRWDAVAASGGSLRLLPEMTGLALNIVGRSMFGTKLDAFTGELEASLSYLQQHLQQGFLLPRWLFPWRKRRFRRAVATIERIVEGVIQERGQGSEQRDLLSLLLSHDGEPMSPRMVRDNVMVMLLGGYETTAAALTWTWYLLSRNPESVRQLDAELEEVLGEGVPTFADVPKLRYTRMVLEEAMRLYPPGWVIPRRVLAGDEVGGFRLRPGSTVLLALFATHRDPSIWPRPEAFDPGRFAPEISVLRPSHSYVPFGGGSRKCPGMGFALLEMTLVLATLAQRYHVDVINTGPVEPEPLLVLRPRQDVVARLRRKSRAPGVSC